MLVFEAGALIFRIQTVGAQLFKQEQRESKDAFEKTGKAAAEAGKQVDESGNATDRTGKKARESKKPLEDQAKATDEVGKKSQQSSQQQEKQAASTERQVEAAKKLSAGLLIAGTAVAALVGLSVAKFTEFDQAMSQTAAATMATADEQRDLGEAALKAGADTAYSASEAAAAEEELAKAGQSVSDIVGGSLNASLGLAAAGQLAVARSAEIMATTMTQFRLPAEQAAHVADVLAAGAGKAQGSVDDLSLALSYVGPLAGSVGLSLDETAGTIAYFATQGVIGEKAGTALRGVLAGLQAPSAAADRELKKYNISVFDANGNMLSLAGIADQLQSNLGGLTEQERLAALGRIFGNESLNAATLLYEGGAQAVEEWTAKVNDSGYAAEQAAMRQDNLAGDVEKLGGAFDTALIRTGSGANDVLRTMVQTVTQVIDVFGEAPAPVHMLTLGLGVAAGAMLLFAGGAIGVRAKLIELKASLDSTGASFTRTAMVGAAAGLALTGVLTVVTLFIARQAQMSAATAEFADTLDETTGAVTENTRSMIAKKLADADVFEQAKKAGIGQKELTDALFEGGDAADTMVRRLVDASAATGGFDIGLSNARNTVRDMADQLDKSKGRHDDLKAATEGSTEATEEGVPVTQSAAEAYLAASEGVADLESDLRTLIDTINEANGVGQDAISSNIAYLDALANVDETIAKAREGQEGYALTLDTSTQAGRDNLGMLNDLAARAEIAAENQFTLDGNTQNYRATLEASRDALIKRAQDFGYTADQAAALADDIFRIPSETEWKVIAETSDAEQRIQRMKDAIAGLRDKTVSINVAYPNGKPISDRQFADQLGFGSANGNLIESYANGGVREHHVAQMARAGAWRVWAEPETGGETYVPHAPSKRARSEAIMAETAAIFGGVYIPAGAASFANGSPVSSPSSGPVSLSLAGAVMTLIVDGKPMRALVQEQIIEARAESATGLSGGESSR
ncbi:phage tail tape measure protein [Microbacterium sp. A1-JK]|uniref:phage tail tape measure protein n=1 Tax=Microbacterium sp. A1-JK TaxID=3177516 RepID=UPI003883C8FF